MSGRASSRGKAAGRAPHYHSKGVAWQSRTSGHVGEVKSSQVTMTTKALQAAMRQVEDHVPSQVLLPATSSPAHPDQTQPSPAQPARTCGQSWPARGMRHSPRRWPGRCVAISASRMPKLRDGGCGSGCRSGRSLAVESDLQALVRTANRHGNRQGCCCPTRSQHRQQALLALHLLLLAPPYNPK